jgi:hypothetical protein
MGAVRDGIEVEAPSFRAASWVEESENVRFSVVGRHHTGNSSVSGKPERQREVRPTEVCAVVTFLSQLLAEALQLGPCHIIASDKSDGLEAGGVSPRRHGRAATFGKNRESPQRWRWVSKDPGETAEPAPSVVDGDRSGRAATCERKECSGVDPKLRDEPVGSDVPCPGRC